MSEGALSSINAPLLKLTRIAWSVLFLFLVITFAIGTVLRYDDLRQPCLGSAETCLPTMRLRPVNLEGVESPEAALRFYALFYTIEQVSIALLLWVIAAFIFWRGRNWVALVAAFWLITFVPPFAEFAAAQRWPWLWALLIGREIVGAICFNLFLFIFPNGQFAPRWMRWPALIFVVFSIVLVLIPTLSTQMAQTIWAGLGLVFEYGFVLYSQWYRYRHVSNPIERQQTKWVVFGMTLGAFFLIGTRIWIGLDWDPDAPISAKFYLQVVGFILHTITIPVTLGIAIFRYRLWDIDLLINRTLVYGILTACVVGGYVGVVGGLGAVFQGQANLLISLLATGLIAVLVQPLRNRLQRTVNRLMYGDRDDPYAVLSRFGQNLEKTLAPDLILPTILETITQTLKLPYAALRLSNTTFITQGVLPLNTNSESFPLVYQGEVIGQLEVAPRAAEEPFTTAEHQLLTDIAHQAGVAAHALRLTIDLQHARERLVTTREEERRRLRRDLHDGLGSKLAGQALILEAVRDSLESSSQSRVLVDHLIEDSHNVVFEIRELVHGLRPPALDELGLISAVRAQAAQCERGGLRVTVIATDPLPSLSAAVEVAAYRIVQEALTNMVRHAQAQSCTVNIVIEGDNSALIGMERGLRIEINDDGIGLPKDRQAGVGLNSMRERTEEIGGRYTVQIGENGGTRVIATLPITAFQ